MRVPFETHAQDSAYTSPWAPQERLKAYLWEITWTLFCRWTPKPFNPWRLSVLRAFGAATSGEPFVHSRARIERPWNLTLAHRACLGDGAVAYALAPVHLAEGCTVAQEAYLCTGTHDFSVPHRPLRTAPISIGKNAFIGARAFVLPGINIGSNAVVGAMAVVTQSVPAGATVAGNPAQVVTSRAETKS